MDQMTTFTSTQISGNLFEYVLSCSVDSVLVPSARLQLVFPIKMELHLMYAGGQGGVMVL